MNNVKIIMDQEWPEWDAFVDSHPMGTIYHTTHWQQLVSHVYKYKPLYLYLRKDNGVIHAGLPLFYSNSHRLKRYLSSTPCAQYCNPLVSNVSDYKIFLDYVLEIIRKEKYEYFEQRISDIFNIGDNTPCAATNNYCTHILDISIPLDKIRASFHKSCIQRPLNKIDNNNLELRVGEREGDLKKFYNLYLKMRKDQGLLPQPYRYFLGMWQLFSKENHLEILNAFHDDTHISSVLLLKYKDTVIYEYGASLISHLKYSPSHFLLWNAIIRAKNDGYKKFNFGRTELSNKGLIDFKSRWGAKQGSLSYYYFPGLKNGPTVQNNPYLKKAMHHAVKILPSSICRILGSIVYKYVV
jgi:hypothetical protein